MTDAIRATEAVIIGRTLADDFAFALRKCRNIHDRAERFCAYSSVAIQVGEYTHSEIDYADAQAVSLELARRMQQ